MTLTNKHGETLEHSLHEGSRDDVLIILGHGVTGNKDRPVIVNTATTLAEAGYPCLRFSFSGNGASEGRFEDSTISKEIDDLTAVIDQVQSGGKKLVYVGHSMGGAVGTLFAARDERLSVLVTLAGMVNTKNFYDAEFGDVSPGSGFMWDEEECPLSQAYKDDLYHISSTIPAIQTIRCPYLMLHGTADDVVLPADSEAAFHAVKCDKEHKTFDGLGHSFTENPNAAPHAIIDFLKTRI